MRSESRLSVWPGMRGPVAGPRSYTSIHQHGGLRREHFDVGRFRNFIVVVVAGVFGCIREYRDFTGFVVELEHRQHLESVGIVDSDAKNDEIRLHALNLRIRMRARLDEDNIVMTGV